MLAAEEGVPLEPLVEEPFGVEVVLGVLLVEVEELDELDPDGSEGRGLESVTYQPEPLKMIPAGWSRRRISPPQDGQTFSGSSLNFCRRSTRDWHPRHSYS